jgi:hypothetical protein
MIQGYFSTTGGRNRPFVKAFLQFPFAIFLEERTRRLFLLEPAEANAIQLP